MATTDALLIGCVTFEQMRGYWPLQTEDATGVLGRGRRLFADATSAPKRRLAEARPLRCGIVLLRYRTAGERGEPA